MWGNRLGWMISAGISVVTIIFYAMLLLGPSISDPTELTMRAGAMDPISLPGSPKALIEGSGSADLYQQAIDGYKANNDAFDRYAKGGKLNSPEFKKIIPTIDLLVDAAGSNSVFGKKAESIVRYNPGQSEGLKPAEELGRTAIKIGIQYNVAKNKEQAKKYLNAGFALGYAMCSERLVYHELRIGQDLMRSAAINLSTIDTEHGADYKSIDAQYKEFFEAQQKYMALCNPADDRTIARNAGDVFNLAQNSQERMWRIESIMMLGHLRYNAGQPGDQRGAESVLTKLAADGSLEAPVATAVKAAQAMTIQEHRTSMQMQ